MNTVETTKARYEIEPEKRVEIKSNFLRKGQGMGGSPTQYDIGYQDRQTGQQFTRDQSQSLLGSPSKKSGIFFPMIRAAYNESSTTVRTRTKGSSFIYSNKSLRGGSHTRNSSLEQLKSAQKEALNEKINRYKQAKLVNQIERMQVEQQEVQSKLEREKALDQRRNKRNQKLKEELASLSEVKMQKEKERKQKEMDKQMQEMNREKHR